MKINEKIKKYLTPKKYSDFILRRIKNLFPNLGDKGERVDINLNNKILLLDNNEKCHVLRYEFAASVINGSSIVADLACGTGYGSALSSKKAKEVVGVDINSDVVESIKNKYNYIKNLNFFQSDLLKINYESFFDYIISFETVEHFEINDISKLLSIFNHALKKDGKLIFSTPYMQKMSDQAIKMGFHKTFNINEEMINQWLENGGFKAEYFMYQNYETCRIIDNSEKKDFIVVIANKIYDK